MNKLPMLTGLSFFLLSSCAGINKSEVYTLLEIPCQSAEVTTSWRGKQLATLCGSKENFALAATEGKPASEFIEAFVKGGLIGGGLYGASTQFPDDFILQFE